MRLRERDDARARCPYCHDLLAAEGERVACRACGTTHHQACLEELGRCPVAGCAAPVPGAAARPATSESEGEAIRRRVRERARAFAKRSRPRAPEPPPPESASIEQRHDSWVLLLVDWVVRNPELALFGGIFGFLALIFALALAG